MACNNLPREEVDSPEMTEMATEGLSVSIPKGAGARFVRGRWDLKSGGLLNFDADARTGALRLVDDNGKRLLAFESTRTTHKLVAGDNEFVLEIKKDTLKKVMEDMKAGKPPQMEKSAAVTVTGDPEMFDKLLRSEAMKELPALSERMGKRLKITGKSNPGALMLHRFAMYVAKVNAEKADGEPQVEPAPMPAPAQKEKGAQNFTPASGDGKVALACLGSNNYVYGNCRNDQDHCGNNCLGMCGEGCKCWDWVCGDCCFHWGCYYHDLRCRTCTWYRPDACFDCYVNPLVFIFALGGCGF